MKKIFVLIPVILAFAGATLLLTNCERDYRCTMKLNCKLYDPISDSCFAVAKHAHVVVGKEEYDARARDEGYTDDNGMYLHVFDYPALLDVAITYYDTLASGEIKYYTGAAQVQLNESETTEKDILMMETQQ